MKNSNHSCKWLTVLNIAYSVWLCIHFTSLDSLAQQALDDNSNMPSLQPAIQTTNDIVAPEEVDDIRDIHNLVKIPYPWLPYIIILGSVIAFHLILFFYQIHIC